MPLKVQRTQSGSNQSLGNQVVGQMGSIQDHFMETLLTQLRYQDPMEPMKEKDLFAQMAQFTTAAQMQSLNANVSWLCQYMVGKQVGQGLFEAAHLIGKQFEAQVSNGSVTGLVESVGVSSGRLVIRSGEYEIPIEDLIWIGGAAYGSEDYEL